MQNQTFSIFKKNNFIKKYIISWVLPLVCFFAYKYYDYFFVLLILIYSVLCGLFYSKLTYVRFTGKEMLYGKNKSINLSKIENLYVITQKAWLFYVFKTSSPNWYDKYVIAEHKGIGLSTLFNLKSFDKKHDCFADLMENETNISRSRVDELFYKKE
jgi:hypothetical protein